MDQTPLPSWHLACTVCFCRGVDWTPFELQRFRTDHLTLDHFAANLSGNSGLRPTAAEDPEDAAPGLFSSPASSCLRWRIGVAESPSMSPGTDATPCTCEKLKFRILMLFHVFSWREAGDWVTCWFQGAVSMMNYGKFLRHILDLINTIHSKVLTFCHLLHHFLASTTQ